MKSESVTKAWEFYRDNCPGFKEPMRKEFRRLDEHVASLESENAKLRELVRDIWHQARLLDANAHIDGIRLTEQARDEYMSRMRELGVEE